MLKLVVITIVFELVAIMQSLPIDEYVPESSMESDLYDKLDDVSDPIFAEAVNTLSILDGLDPDYDPFLQIIQQNSVMEAMNFIPVLPFPPGFVTPKMAGSGPEYYDSSSSFDPMNELVYDADFLFKPGFPFGPNNPFGPRFPFAADYSFDMDFRRKMFNSDSIAYYGDNNHNDYFGKNKFNDIDGDVGEFGNKVDSFFEGLQGIGKYEGLALTEPYYGSNGVTTPHTR